MDALRVAMVVYNANLPMYGLWISICGYFFLRRDPKISFPLICYDARTRSLIVFLFAVYHKVSRRTDHRVFGAQILFLDVKEIKNFTSFLLLLLLPRFFCLCSPFYRSECRFAVLYSICHNFSFIQCWFCASMHFLLPLEICQKVL